MPARYRRPPHDQGQSSGRRDADPADTTRLSKETPVAIDFSIEPEFQAQLDWVRKFTAEKIEVLDHSFGGLDHEVFDFKNEKTRPIVRALQAEVKAKKMWNAHLDPKLGGLGYGQVKMALLNEIIGRTIWGPLVFGCQAPDSGNSKILAMYGSEEQKERFLKPLLNGDSVSCFSMTEPEWGSDPTAFQTTAVEDGDHWVISGEKWFSSQACYADFLIVVAATDPDGPPHRRLSMFLVPSETLGIEIVRDVGLWFEPLDGGSHGYVRYNQVRVPKDHMLGKRGEAFVVAQARLGGGRIHHAMRTLGLCHKALEMMRERAVSRKAKGGTLANLQMVQNDIALSWAQLQQYRLMILQTAWFYDQNDDENAKLWTSALKATTATVAHDIFWRAMHLHGSLGISNEMPFGRMIRRAASMGVADGPTEVHLVNVAKMLLKATQPHEGLFPSEHVLGRKAWAEAKLPELMAAADGQAEQAA
jgi:acyl-CoA dehydrogenase